MTGVIPDDRFPVGCKPLSHIRIIHNREVPASNEGKVLKAVNVFGEMDGVQFKSRRRGNSPEKLVGFFVRRTMGMRTVCIAPMDRGRRNGWLTGRFDSHIVQSTSPVSAS